MLLTKQLFLSITAGLMFITACTDQSGIDGNSMTEVEPNISGEISSIGIDVCEPINIPGVFFPRQEYTEGPRSMMEAELIGELTLTDGCLQVDSLYGDGMVIPIWPPEFTINSADNRISVLNGEGRPIITAGEEVYMGGGEGSETGLLSCVLQQLPAACRGQIWFVGDGVRPNLQFESPLFDLELVTSTDRTAILLEKKPVLDEWRESPSTIIGNLVLYSPNRCPRIQSESGISDYMPIWPPGYSMEFKNGFLEIINEKGTVIAQEGDLLTLPGGSIPHSYDSENYRQLHDQLPGDCHAPYWIVGN